MDNPCPGKRPTSNGVWTVDRSLRTALGFGVALLVWVFPSKIPTLLLLIGASLAAMPFWRRALSLWLQPAGLAAIAVALYAVLSLLWNPHPALSARELLKDLPLALGLFALSVWVSNPQKIERALLTSAALLALLFAADAIRLKLALGTSDLLTQARYYKPYWLTHPNTAGMLAVLTFWTGLYAAFARRPSSRLWTAGGLAIAVPPLVHLYLMGSRGPQAALALSAVVALILAPSTFRGRLAGTAAAILLVVFAAILGPRLNQRFALRDNLAGRTIVWRQTWLLTRERPWLGYGYGKKLFEKVYYEDAAPPPPAPHRFPHPHQYFLFALFQGGRIGLALRLTLWLLLGWSLLRACQPDTPDRYLRILITLQLLTLHLYGMADFPDSQAGMALLALIVPALMLARLPTVSQAEQPNRVTCTSA